MKIAVLIIAYNEERYIGACIKQWEGLVDKVVVLLSAKPWNGVPSEADRTEMIARKMGAEVIIQDWRTEAEQRSWGCARLYDYDFVIINDADEFYTREDRVKIIEHLEKNKNEPCFRCPNMVTYWKTPEYIFDPPDGHKPIIVVNPKKVKFYEHRQPMPVEETKLQEYQPIIPVTMHHFSWVRSDKEVKEKIEHYSHADIIKPNWYEDVWLKWEPNMDDIRPYGIERSRAVYNPAPKEITNLIEQCQQSLL